MGLPWEYHSDPPLKNICIPSFSIFQSSRASQREKEKEEKSFAAALRSENEWLSKQIYILTYIETVPSKKRENAAIPKEQKNLPFFRQN